MFFCCCYLSDLLKNILKCNCSLFNLDENYIYLVQYYAAIYYNHSPMRKHNYHADVSYVYWIDTDYVQNNL